MTDFHRPTQEEIPHPTNREEAEAFPGSGFERLAHWQGYVDEELADGTFGAALKDVTGGGDDFWVELKLSAISLDDHDQIKLGWVFEWAIGSWADDPSKEVCSYIRFHRPKPLTAEDLAAVRARAEELADRLGFAKR